MAGRGTCRSRSPAQYRLSNTDGSGLKYTVRPDFRNMPNRRVHDTIDVDFTWPMNDAIMREFNTFNRPDFRDQFSNRGKLNHPLASDIHCTHHLAEVESVICCTVCGVWANTATPAKFFQDGVHSESITLAPPVPFASCSLSFSAFRSQTDLQKWGR
eukprot:2874859-Pyramimonas_sp.AAC.3